MTGFNITIVDMATGNENTTLYNVEEANEVEAWFSALRKAKTMIDGKENLLIGAIEFLYS